MRVLQLIDTLQAGGAENMAVNLANLLVDRVEASYLCCTRSSGVLEKKLKSEVGFLSLNKKNSIDILAFNRLKAFVAKNDIDIIHAHSTSFFFGCLLKIFNHRLKLVWHDHYGESENLDNRNARVLKRLSRYFDGVFVVNNNLKKWTLENLKVDKILELKNFVDIGSFNDEGENFTFLRGAENFRIACVANLRPQKNQLELIEAFEMIENQDISLHLFGANPNTAYSAKVLVQIKISPKSDKIFYYGAQENISSILKKFQLGILASRSEGLPLVLLEYAYSGLPVVCTNVGENKSVCGDFAKIVEPNDPKALANAIIEYYIDEKSRLQDSLNLKLKVEKDFNINTITEELIHFYKYVLD